MAETTTKQRVGLIGVGLMGLPIAVNLIKAGYEVVGYRRSDLREFVEAGGIAAESPQDVVRAADVVLECLPSAEAFAEVVSGPNGIVHAVRPGQIVVNLSTSPLPVKLAQAEALAAHGAKMIEGEVSGLPSMIAAKKGVVYLAGDAQAVESIRPVVAAFADRSFHVGSFGCALKLKLIANHLVTVHAMAAGEAMALAAKSGLDPHLVAKVVSAGAGGSVQFEARAPMMAARRFEPVQGPFNTLAHYFPLMRDMARQANAITPLLDTAVRYFEHGIHVQGMGQQDIARIGEVLESFKAELR
jgi:3-hydroxyisobutyrate dehydrogenase